MRRSPLHKIGSTVAEEQDAAHLSLIAQMQRASEGIANEVRDGRVNVLNRESIGAAMHVLWEMEVANKSK